MDHKSKNFGIGGYRGRIIFLGDGTEVLTDSDDTEMFDNAEEDKDLASQVSKGSSTAHDGDEEVIGSPTTPEKLDLATKASEIAAAVSPEKEHPPPAASQSESKPDSKAAEEAAEEKKA